ncbi:MAG: thioredoxin family protein [Candidatus Synoicihabitans palmerolidicus]|nr:thioredoxin family protein [Candidatus Synoicihabitans palmerolidicus]
MKLLFACLLFVTAVHLPAQEYPKMGPDIYNTTANAAPAIGQVLKITQAQNKHVLLDFGANWCIWYHRLQRVFTTNKLVSSALKRDYIVVMIDTNRRHGTARNADVVESYGKPIRHGLPVLMVLDASGRVLTTQETGALEHGDAHDPAKILAFLRKWAP